MQDWFKSMVENSPHFLILLDKDFKTLYINKTVNGVMAEDLIGAYMPTLAGPDMELTEQKLTLALKTNEQQSYITHFDDPYGTRHYFKTYVQPLAEEIDGAVLYLVSRETSSPE